MSDPRPREPESEDDFVPARTVVADIDEAIRWARRSPASAPGGHVEIRPVAPY